MRTRATPPQAITRHSIQPAAKCATMTSHHIPMKTIHDKYDKRLIQTLPRALFEGRIITIFTENEADKAIKYLMRQKLVGMDTETRPTFKKGVRHQVALLQLSTNDTCFLLRLNRFGLTDSIIRFLEDKTVTKVGLSLHDDFRNLALRRPFSPGAYIELQHEVKEIGIEDMSLQKIYANIFGGKIAKNQQLSNWEADSLSEAQQRYAATDAWACIKIHEEVLRMKRENDYILEYAATKELDADRSAKDAATAV